MKQSLPTDNAQPEKKGGDNRLTKLKLRIFLYYYLSPIILYIFLLWAFRSIRSNNYYFNLAFTIILSLSTLSRLIFVKYKFITGFTLAEENIRLAYITPFLKETVQTIRLETLLDIEVTRPNFLAESGELNIKTTDKSWVSFDLFGKSIREEIRETVATAHLSLPKG